MKHGKKPTVRQCELLRKYRLDPRDWLIVKDMPDRMEIVHRHFDSTKKVLPKGVVNDD